MQERRLHKRRINMVIVRNHIASMCIRSVRRRCLPLANGNRIMYLRVIAVIGGQDNQRTVAVVYRESFVIGRARSYIDRMWYNYTRWNTAEFRISISIFGIVDA